MAGIILEEVTVCEGVVGGIRNIRLKFQKALHLASINISEGLTKEQHQSKLEAQKQDLILRSDERTYYHFEKDIDYIPNIEGQRPHIAILSYAVFVRE